MQQQTREKHSLQTVTKDNGDNATQCSHLPYFKALSYSVVHLLRTSSVTILVHCLPRMLLTIWPRIFKRQINSHLCLEFYLFYHHYYGLELYFFSKLLTSPAKVIECSQVGTTAHRGVNSWSWRISNQINKIKKWERSSFCKWKREGLDFKG